MSLKDFFPKEYTPRKQQLDALDKIESIWTSGKKFAIGVLPTGSGKSHISKTIANSSRDIDPYLESLILNYQIYKRRRDGGFAVEDDFLNAESYGAFILTITKSLQDQYHNLFSDDFTIKGKSNYQCFVDNDFTTDFAPCSLSTKQKQTCFDENCCPYYRNRNQGLASKGPFLNYNVFFNLPEFLRKRQYLILDEASELEEELVGKYSVKINYKILEFEKVIVKPLKSENLNVAKNWLVDIRTQLEIFYDDAVAEASTNSSNNNYKNINPKLVKKISRLNNMIKELDQAFTYWTSCQYMVESLDDEGATFTPYDIRPLTQILFDGADKVLMMSATISNPVEYAKSLGIDRDDFEFFEISSSFDPKKSPILCSKKYNLSFKTMEQFLPKIIESAISVCETHANEKGVIHCHSNRILQEVRRQIGDDPRYLFREPGVTNEDLLEIHKNSTEPTIMVSPSMDTGVSLDDDLGRFQIICKAPYLPLGSNRIKRLFKEFPKRYAMKMLDNVIQMSGRCTRSIDDYSITYILDGTLVSAIQRENSHLPKHFLERFK